MLPPGTMASKISFWSRGDSLCTGVRLLFALLTVMAASLPVSSLLSSAGQAQMRQCCPAFTAGKCLQLCYQIAAVYPTDPRSALYLAKGNANCSFFYTSAPVWFCFTNASQLTTETPAPTTSPSSAPVTSIAPKLKVSHSTCTITNCTRPDTVSHHWCCTLAVSSECREQCDKVQTGGSQGQILHNCLLSEKEAKMSTCLREIQTPAWPSCSGLKFCTNFNRPLYQYTNCSFSADKAAFQLYVDWRQSGIVRIPSFGLQFPVNISKCESASFWKALSCLISISPTNTKFDGRMCMSSCLRILNNCHEVSPSLSAASCDAAYPSFVSKQPDCIDLEKFLTPPKFPSRESLTSIVNPCSPNPCGKRQCLVNHDCLQVGHCTSNYTCLPGCAVDNAGSYVSDKQWVHLPLLKNADSRNNTDSSFYYCQCSDRRFSRCVHISRPLRNPCGNVRDGEVYSRLDGSKCLCQDGAASCTVDFTQLSTSSKLSQVKMLLFPAEKLDQHGPCGLCSQSLDPVCGNDGRTYLNDCFLSCSHSNVSRTGKASGVSCVNKVMPSSTCPTNYSLLPQPGTCLSSLATCTQFSCESSSCPWSSDSVPFCDSCGVQHATVCTLKSCLRVSQHSPVSCMDQCHWAYAGRCRHGCTQYGPVCGANGQTYESQCALEASAVPLDYTSACTHINITENRVMECSDVQCPVLPWFCKPLPRLPATCCPMCGSVLSIVMSSAEGEAYSEGTEQPSVRIKDILLNLQQLRSLPSCHVRGYLLGKSLVVTVQSNYAKDNGVFNTTRAQVESCISQAITINTMIDQQMSSIKLSPSLSTLMASSVLSSLLDTGTEKEMVSQASVAVPMLSSVYLMILFSVSCVTQSLCHS